MYIWCSTRYVPFSSCYDLVPRGSVESHLHGEYKLVWLMHCNIITTCKWHWKRLDITINKILNFLLFNIIETCVPNMHTYSLCVPLYIFAILPWSLGSFCFSSVLTRVDKEISPLDCHARMKIALGATQGLAYLHEDLSPCVIHRDFKSSNKLLEHLQWWCKIECKLTSL